MKAAGTPAPGLAEKFFLTASSRQKFTRKATVLRPTGPGNPDGGRFEKMIAAGVTKGLDWRIGYHIIKNSFKAAKAAAAGRGPPGKPGEPGGLRGE